MPTDVRARSASPARSRLAGAVLAGALAFSARVDAWSNHALCTWPSLASVPAVVGAAPVQVEPLETFLAAEAVPIAAVLADEERWARVHVPLLPPRPAALTFVAGDGASPAELRRRFIAAVRIHPASRLSLFVQVFPGRSLDGREAMPEGDVTTLQRSATTHANTYARLREGERATVLDVVATASDEPDLGLDVGLFADNGTAAGRSYGFGKQPFGFNAQIEYASQGPFHVGFFHEAPIVYAAAPFLLRSYSEARIHLWRTLAAHAMASGHPYWGWRFAGWALHYVQDLTQPYHAKVLPGVGVPTMLWINTLDVLGAHGAKERAIALVTNRHLAIENYQLHRMRSAWRVAAHDDPAWRALADASHDGALVDDDASPRAVITAESFAFADALDDVLARALPPRLVFDPLYVFGRTEPDVDLERVARALPRDAQTALDGALVALLGRFGRHTRAFVRSLPLPGR